MSGNGRALYDSNMKTGRDAIRTYDLFGESARLPDVMHCETIAARSALHDWEVTPHRHQRLHQLLLVTRGGGSARLEGGVFPLSAGSLVNVPPGDVHGLSFLPGTEGFVATLADELLEELLAASADVRRTLGRSCVVRADMPLRSLLRQVWREFNGRSTARALVLRGLCGTLLGLAARAIARAEPAQEVRSLPPLLRRFEALIEVHYLEQWKVADYARELAVTPTHLTRVTRAAHGLPASRLIDARVMREARRNLAYTALSVSSIAYALGYADPAYFSRVFTRTLGVSPSAFRERLAVGAGAGAGSRQPPER